MGLEDKIVLHCITLTDFNNKVERILGEITLSILAGGVTFAIIFHIMDQDTAYNAIVERPWIYLVSVVPSSLYEMIKFSTHWEIFSTRGE